VITPPLMMQASDVRLPSAPSPEQFAQYGFAGVIFGAFFFLICIVLFFGWKFFTNRDKWFMEAQDRRDTILSANLATLGQSHEKVVSRLADSVEKIGDANVKAQQETAAALREVQREVAAQAHKFGEETIMSYFRRAMRDVAAEGKRP
jgi:hypothetical protein